MSRIVSVWLPAWPIERLARRQPGRVPAGVPFALVEAGIHGLHITAANAAALGAGAAVGTALADARAMLPGLLTAPAEIGRGRRRH